MSAVAVESAPPVAPRGWVRWLRRGVFATLAGAILSAPWWGPPTLSKLDFFRVRHVEFEGVRFADTRELVERMALDTTASIWHDLDAYAARLAGDPLVRSADITRRVPGTVVVRIVERVPVALTPTNTGMTPVDADGHVLPINPAATPVDAPIAPGADTVMLRFLDGLRVGAPDIYARVVELRRTSKTDLWMQLADVVVRMRDDVTVARLQDILRVQAALKQQNQRVVELDLRFQDQVIARLP